MDHLSGHLSDLEIEQYGATVPATQPTTDRGGKDSQTEHIEAHLADCPACRQRVLTSQRKRLGLVTDPPVNSHHHADGESPHPDCPSEDALRDLAAGLTPPEQASQLTQHAAQCDHCGPLLRMYTEDFADDLSPEDQAVLSKLKSGSVAWQEKLVKRMVAESRATVTKPEGATTRKPFLWRWVMAPGAVASVAVVVFAIWYSQRETPEKVQKLLAQASTKDRTIEMRFPGAEWAPLHATLGPESSRFSKRPELLKAEEIIIRRQSADPDNVEWRNAKAEAELLDGPPETAIATLANASANPESMQLLAIAYLQQAQVSHDRQAYVRAIDLLAKITRDDPRNKEAQFNLALAYTRAELWDQAAVAWESYLRLDPDSPWAKEARQQLQLARERLKSTRQGPPDSQMNAVTFLGLSDADVEFNSEQYQEIALRRWSPAAIADPESTEYHAVTRLAQIVANKHSDLWLRDFLGLAKIHGYRGAELLSRALEESLKGRYANAIQNAQRAEEFFHKWHNLAGELRARYESVYAYQRSLDGKACLSGAGPLEASLVGTPYHWLQAQVPIVRAICLNFVSKLKDVEPALQSSLKLAKQFGFQILIVRNLGMTQGLENQQGRYNEAWETGLRGLGEYWAGPPAIQRVYQLYVGLALSAENRGFWSAADALQRHAVMILEKEDDRIQRGAARLELARILMAEKLDSEAERELLEANRLLDSEPGEPTARSYRLTGKMGLADLELRRGRPQEALSTLEPAQELLSATDAYFVSLHYYRLLGSTRLQLKQLELAEDAYKAAIVIAERSLRGIKNERDRLQWVQASDEAYRGLVRVFVEQRRHADALRFWEWYQSRSFEGDSSLATRGKSRHAGTWEAIWAAADKISLGTNGAIRIVFAVFDDGVQLWADSGDRIATAWVAIPKERLDEKVRQFAQTCARRESSLAEVQKQGRDLFELLMQPVANVLVPGTLVILELDRSLAGMPVEALRSPNDWYFAEKYPIVYSPGVLAERRLRPMGLVGSNRAVLLVDGSGAKGYLPGQELEREAVSTHFPHHTVLGADSNLATLRALLPQSDIFGFMGHGEPDGADVALRLSPGLLLKAQDFPPRTLRRIQLAVLAACSTGPYGDSGVLNTQGLVHAFLAGRVPNVLASRWDVDAEQTGRLMKTFYYQLGEGETVARALSVARFEGIKSLGHPYFWASFRLVGRAG